MGGVCNDDDDDDDTVQYTIAILQQYSTVRCYFVPGVSELFLLPATFSSFYKA